MKKKSTLICTVCLERNYTITSNYQSQQKRIELNKYCKKCNKHTLHKQS